MSTFPLITRLERRNLADELIRRALGAARVIREGELSSEVVVHELERLAAWLSRRADGLARGVDELEDE